MASRQRCCARTGLILERTAGIVSSEHAATALFTITYLTMVIRRGLALIPFRTVKKRQVLGSEPVSERSDILVLDG